MNYDIFSKDNKNKFYPITIEEIEKVEEELEFTIPKELKNFYLQVGYGFINGSEFNINRIMDANSIRDFRLRQGDFEFYPDIDIYDEFEEDKLIFFEGSESALISIELTKNSKSKIFYYDVKIADSLQEFLEKILEDDNYYLNMLE